VPLKAIVVTGVSLAFGAPRLSEASGKGKQAGRLACVKALRGGKARQNKVPALNHGS